jgi:hypothetical protein
MITVKQLIGFLGICFNEFVKNISYSGLLIILILFVCFIQKLI